MTQPEEKSTKSIISEDTRKLGITEHKKIEKELKFGGPLKQTSSKFISKPEEFRTKLEYREPNPGSKEGVTYFDFDDDWTRKLGITEHKKIEKELKFGGPLKQTSSKFISKPEEFRIKPEYREPNPGSKEDVTYFDFDDDWTRKLGITEHKKIEKELKFGGPLKQTSSKFISKPEEFRTKPEYREPNPGSKEDVTYFDFDDDWQALKKRWYDNDETKRGEEEIKRAREINLPRGNGIDTVLLLFAKNKHEFKKVQSVAVDYITTVKKMNRFYGVQENVALVVSTGTQVKVVRHLTCQYDDVLSSLGKYSPYYNEKFECVLDWDWYKVRDNITLAYSAIVAQGRIGMLNGYALYPRIIVISSRDVEENVMDMILNYVRNTCPKHLVYVVSSGNPKQNYNINIKANVVEHRDGGRLARHLKNLVTFSKLAKGPFTEKGTDTSQTDKKMVSIPMPEEESLFSHDLKVKKARMSELELEEGCSPSTSTESSEMVSLPMPEEESLFSYDVKLKKARMSELELEEGCSPSTSTESSEMVSLPMPEEESLFSYDVKLKKARMSELELEESCSPSTSTESSEFFMSRTNVEERHLAGVKTKTIVETMLHLLDNDADFHDADMVDILQIVKHSYNLLRFSKRNPYYVDTFKARLNFKSIIAEYPLQMEEAIAAIRKTRWDTLRTIVASIELGSTYSGYAFSTIPDNMHENMEYATFKKRGKGKTRTMLLLNPDTSFRSFGYEAEQHFLNLTKEKMEYYFFDFKNMNLSSSTSFKNGTNKEMSGEDVFSHIIRHLKNGIEKEVLRKFETQWIAGKDIWYTLVIPDTWNNRRKCIMEATTLAGIDKERFVVIQKTEAAVSNLRDIPLLKSEQKAIKPGEKIMVAYLGGATTHFSSYKVQEGWSFKELGHYNPEFVCGNSVNTAFIKYLENDFGSDNMENLKRDNLDAFVRLCSEFEHKKFSVRENVDVLIRLPKDLQKLKESELPYDFSSHLTLEYDTFCGFFQPVIDRIVSSMRECLLKKEFYDVSVILMAGGFSECELVQNAIQGTFENKRVYIPDDPKLTMLSGGIVCDQIVQHILSHSKKENDFGFTLVLASRCGDIETVKKAIHDDAGLNAKSLRKALDVALQFNQDEIAQELIKAGADVNIANLPTNQFYALEDISLAVEENNIPTLKHLTSIFFHSDLKKKVWNILYVAAVKGTSEMCEYLIKQGFPTDSHVMQNAVAQILNYQQKDDISHISPLSLAIHHKNIHNVKILAHRSNETSLGKCIDLVPDIETIVLKEICVRLKTKHLSLKPMVVAGHYDGKACLIVYTDSAFYPETEEYGGRKVIIKNPRFLEKQDMTMLEKSPKISQESMTIAKRIINERGDYLWKTHSNLNIITVSPIKYGCGDEEIKDCCIALFCSSKGFIPLEEKPFPKSLSTLDGKYTFPVDTLEGYFEFCPYRAEPSWNYHQQLKMGCSIGEAGGRLNAGGTLGPFVNINGAPGFLTCAHVLFDITQPPLRYDISTSPRVDVVQPSAFVTSAMSQPGNVLYQTGITPCGCVQKAVFDANLNVSVDVAAVTITNPNRLPQAGQFAIGDPSKLRDEGFDDLPLYNSGISRDISNIDTWVIVCKFGKATHLTRGIIAADGTQVRSLNTCLGLPNGNNVVMKNQIAVASLNQSNVFFQSGDSGSGVFTRRNGSLECIGIAIGLMSNQHAVVTPIDAILTELGPGISLQSFP